MKVLHYLRGFSLRRKLTLLLIAPCMVVLLVACLALLGFQVRMFRADFARDIQAVSDIVSANSTAAVAFNDARSAAETLASLRANQYIRGAILVLPDGTVFASYGEPVSDPVVEAQERFVFRDSDTLMIQPVLLEGEQVATLNVVSDHRGVYADLLKLVAWMLALVVVVGAGVAALLSNYLQRFISGPVLRLARAAQTVADDQDYSVRVREESGVEMGILTRTFNQMLARIRQQEEAITRLSQQKLDALVNSIEGIVWECAADTFRFTFVSRQCERILGYPPEQWTAEDGFWEAHLHPDDAAWAIQVCRDHAVAGSSYTCEYRMIAADGRVVWIRESGSSWVENGKPVSRRGISQDITRQKAAAAELDDLHRRLLETSRQAGMAEVATGVLHNVGNVLNSVNVSTDLVLDRLRQSRIASLPRLAELFEANASDLGRFFTTDPRGRQVPGYVASLARHLGEEQGFVLDELGGLRKHIDHIKEIVAMQQNYARISGIAETVTPTHLVEDALQLNAGALSRHGVTVVRNFANVPAITVEKHKVLQILVNLIRNAKYAMDESRQEDKRLEIRILALGDARVRIEVADNGVGIPPDHLTRIFQHGFTTRQHGHGFGLHSGALAALELGGSLTVTSPGPGLGATFALELPAAPPKS